MSVSISGTNTRVSHPRFPHFPASVDLDEDDPRAVNWCNANAAAMFALLGLGGDGCLLGQATLPETRRAILRARATFDRRVPALERPEVIEHGAPCEHTDGTIELRPVRVWSMGLDASGMRTRLDAFERAVSALEARGATDITWG